MMRLRPVVLALALLALAGCGDKYGGRQPVSGTVTLKKGAFPVKEASIQFQPLDGQDTTAGAAVVDGKYSIPQDAGLKPGKYVVRLTAGDGKTSIGAVGKGDEDAGGPGGNTNIVSVDLIPPEYGVASKQQATVEAGKPLVFDIDLPALVDPKSLLKKGKS